MTNQTELGGPPGSCSSPDSPRVLDVSFTSPRQQLLRTVKSMVFSVTVIQNEI